MGEFLRLKAQASHELDRLELLSSQQWGYDPFYNREDVYLRFRSLMGITCGNRAEQAINTSDSTAGCAGQILSQLDSDGLYIFEENLFRHASCNTLNEIVSRVRALARSSQKRSFKCIEGLGIVKNVLTPQVLEQISLYLETTRPFIYTPQVLYFKRDARKILTTHDLSNAAFLYHRDIDNSRFIKLFICLTSTDGGAHRYVRGSHLFSSSTELVLRSQEIKDRTFSEASEAQTEYETHLITGRFSDISIENIYGVHSVEEIPVIRGLAWLEDTYGLHRGSLPNDSNERIVLSCTIGKHAYRYN
jgi:hypothetical protein